MFIILTVADGARILREFHCYRFRAPYQYFKNLTDELEGCMEACKRWKMVQKTDLLGINAAPIFILLLVALKYKGDAWTVDDLQEARGVSEC